MIRFHWRRPIPVLRPDLFGAVFVVEHTGITFGRDYFLGWTTAYPAEIEGD